MKTLVIGKGYLGERFAEYFEADSIDHPEVDVTSLESLSAVLDRFKPGLVINAAGSTNTHQIEKIEHRAQAFRVNVQGPTNLAYLAHERGFRLVQLSSGMIYDGEAPDGQGWKESATPQPISYYAWTKAWADVALEPFAARDSILIIRLHVPVSARNHPRNLLNKMMQFDSAVTEPSSMTIVEDLLLATKKLVELQATGIFHVVNPGTISFYAVAACMQKYELISKDKEIKKTSKLELAETIAGSGGAQQVYPHLSTEKLESFGITLAPIQEAIERCCQQLKQELS